MSKGTYSIDKIVANEICSPYFDGKNHDLGNIGVVTYDLDGCFYPKTFQELANIMLPCSNLTLNSANVDVERYNVSQQVLNPNCPFENRDGNIVSQTLFSTSANISIPNNFMTGFTECTHISVPGIFGNISLQQAEQDANIQIYRIYPETNTSYNMMFQMVSMANTGSFQIDGNPIFVNGQISTVSSCGSVQNLNGILNCHTSIICSNTSFVPPFEENYPYTNPNIVCSTDQSNGFVDFYFNGALPGSNITTKVETVRVQNNVQSFNPNFQPLSAGKSVAKMVNSLKPVSFAKKPNIVKPPSELRPVTILGKGINAVGGIVTQIPKQETRVDKTLELRPVTILGKGINAAGGIVISNTSVETQIKDIQKDQPKPKKEQLSAFARLQQKIKEKSQIRFGKK